MKIYLLRWWRPWVAILLVLTIWLSGGCQLAPTPTPTPTATCTPTATRPPTSTATRTMTPTCTHTATPSATAPPSPTRTATSSPTATTTATPTRTATPTPSGTATWTPRDAAADRPEEHYWLARPVPPDAEYFVDRYYPYGSTAAGYYPIHHGVEFVNPLGVPVLAVAAGEVVVAGDDLPFGTELQRLLKCQCEDDNFNQLQPIYGPKPGFYGNLVIIKLDRVYHDAPVFCLYGHLSAVLVSRGQHVERGAVLGKVGMTGVALGPHLHFEVRVGENSYWHTRNPELWLTPLPQHGTIAGRFVDTQGRHLAEKLITFRRAAAPDEFWRETWTYPRREVNAADAWGENFVMGDVPVGKYIVHGHIGTRSYSAEVAVEAGETAFVELIAR